MTIKITLELPDWVGERRLTVLAGIEEVATGELTWGATTDSVDGNAVTSGEAGCAGAGTWADGLEREGANDVTALGSLGTWTEFHWARDASSAGDSKQYEFRVWNVSDGVSAGTCLADITTEAGAP